MVSLVKCQNCHSLSKSLGKFNISITSINISYNDIGIEGAKYIIDAIKSNNSINNLNFCHLPKQYF